ncbi:MAG: GNAT family N-acetyltransferase [Fibrobacterota bacterium]
MNFKEASRKDLLFLFHLRNDSESVRYSKKGKLSIEQIEDDYFHNPDKKVFIAEKEEAPVGYLIFEHVEPEVFEISLAISPQHRGKGLGKEIVNEGTDFAIHELRAKRIIARVFSKNIPSLTLFQYCSYTVVNNKDEPWTFVSPMDKARNNTIQKRARK